MKPASTPRETATTGKVIWSEAERARVVSRAVDVQVERPDLAGLPLLREAMLSLPVHRRRRILAVTQAPWFEEGVSREIKRRAAEASSIADLLPLMKQAAVANSTVAERQAVFMEIHESWRSEEMAKLDRVIGLLESVLAELRKLSGGHPPRVRTRTGKRA